MATVNVTVSHDKPKIDEVTYRKRIRAWTLYDWANSAFATTIMAAVLPAYYSAVAGSTLPSAATATAYWSLTNSIALFIIALLSPILGTVSDVMRGKKKFLSLFIGIGTVATGLLILISTGDWFLASLFYIVGRVGFGGANVFYDSLLPHVATEEDQDRVSTRGYAMGYFGGGILLIFNVIMIQMIPDDMLASFGMSDFAAAGIRLSFLSVAIWWAVFSIPILRDVPEPPSATQALNTGETLIGASFSRLRQTFADMRQYSELFKYLIAFLVYNDAIGTIIGLAVIYGAELGFATLELVMALLMVQFVGVPFTLIFGSLPSRGAGSRSHYYLAFIAFNAIVLPIVGVLAAINLSADVTGKPPTSYETTETHFGEGTYLITDDAIKLDGSWETVVIAPEDQVGSGLMGQLTLAFSAPDEVTYAQSMDGIVTFPMNGQRFEVKYAAGPESGIWQIEVDGDIVTDPDNESDGTPLLIDTTDDVVRYGNTKVVQLPEPGQYFVRLIPMSGSGMLQVAAITIMVPLRSSNLMIILGILLAVQAVGVVFAFLFGRFFKPLSDTLDTRRSILVSIGVYCIVAVWGYFLQATIEFWYLAWMIAIVQGGSQALSRSLYASMTPTSKSGEFFGLFSIMTKFSSIIGPLLFALAVAIFGNSRPAILSLIILFFLGGFLLTRVNIEAGIRVAKEEDAKLLATSDS